MNFHWAVPIYHDSSRDDHRPASRDEKKKARKERMRRYEKKDQEKSQKKETKAQMKRQEKRRYSGRICFPEVSLVFAIPKPTRAIGRKKRKKRDEPLRPAQIQDGHHGDKKRAL
jgi:hypothetical protein